MCKAEDIVEPMQFKCITFTFPSGKRYKFDSLLSICDYFANNNTLIARECISDVFLNRTV